MLSPENSLTEILWTFIGSPVTSSSWSERLIYWSCTCDYWFSGYCVEGNLRFQHCHRTNLLHRYSLVSGRIHLHVQLSSIQHEFVMLLQCWPLFIKSLFRLQISLSPLRHTLQHVWK